MFGAAPQTAEPTSKSTTVAIYIYFMLKALKKGTEQENDAHGAQRETCSNPGELLDMAKCFNDSMVYYCPVRMNRYIIPQDRY